MPLEMALRLHSISMFYQVCSSVILVTLVSQSPTAHEIYLPVAQRRAKLERPGFFAIESDTFLL
jgi:hypothetical protein